MLHVYLFFRWFSNHHTLIRNITFIKFWKFFLPSLLFRPTLELKLINLLFYQVNSTSSRYVSLNPIAVDVLVSSYSRGGATTTQGWENGRYLSRLWSNFQNSFLWWKLVKIVTYFYSISNFLSIIVWPLDVAKVTKVCRVNFFEQKIQNFQFWATNMLYTSNESWNYVEFKFITKK